MFYRLASIVPGFLSNENGTYYLNEDGTFRTGWYDAGDGDIYYFNLPRERPTAVLSWDGRTWTAANIISWMTAVC